jgi:hypothetical protein
MNRLDGSGKGNGLQVKSVKSAGHADQTGKIKVGMIIEKINGKDIRNMTTQEAKAILKKGSEPIKINFMPTAETEEIQLVKPFGWKKLVCETGTSKGKSTLYRAIEWFGDSAPAIPARMILNDGPFAIPLDRWICEEEVRDDAKPKDNVWTPLIWCVGQKQTHAAGKLMEMGIHCDNEEQMRRYNIPKKFLSRIDAPWPPCTPFELSIFTGAVGCN